LDGATFTVIDFLVGRGRLPHLAALTSDGARAPLDSTVPPHSAAAWPSLVTGRNPGHHGLYEFYRRRAGSYRLEPINGGCVPGPKLWDLVGAAGKRVCVFNVPISYPPEAVNGVMVSGLDTPGRESDFASPASLKVELLKLFPDYAIEIDEVERALRRERGPASGAARSERRGLLLRQLDQELAVADFLLAQEDWDLAFLVITAPDRAQHLFWSDFETLGRGEPVAADSALVAAYERADAALGRWRRRYPNRNWVVISDHGFGPLEKEFYLEQFLAENGWLRLRSSAGRAWELAKGAARKPSRIARPLAALARQSAERLGEGQAALPAWVLDDPQRAVDWRRTRAYAVGDTGAIFLNLEGREPQGAVKPADYERVREDLAAALLELRDPEDGRPVVDRVFRREELYAGPRLAELPDLHIRLRDYSCRVVLHHHGPRGRYFGRPPERKPELYDTGAHRRDGIFLAAGTGFARGARLERAALLDVLPTVLHALGVPVPQDAEGRVLEEIFAGEFMRAHPISRSAAAPPAAAAAPPGYSQEEERKISERLRQLGYLD